MRIGRRKTSADGADKLWPLLVVLLLAVLAPTGCVLWFMATAMRNERWAVRQRLSETYHEDLVAASKRLADHLDQRIRAIVRRDRETPSRTFARLVRSGAVDSAVIYDDAGEVAYPIQHIPDPSPADPSESWLRAAELEQDDLPAEAAKAYAAVATRANNVHVRARALQAQVRCLIKAGSEAEALAVLTGPLANFGLRDAHDSRGGLITPSAALLAAQLMDAQDPRLRQIADALAQQLNDYDDLPMLSSQRRFLMRELLATAAPDAKFDTLDAEALAGEYLQAYPPLTVKPGLTKAPTAGLWRLASEDGKIVALLRRDRLVAAAAAGAKLDDSPARTAMRLAAPDAEDDGKAFISIPAALQAPGWRLELRLLGDNPFAAAADKQRMAHLWTGVLTISGLVILALVAWRRLSRQVKLTRLKNDLIATVTHELKTPLASMRAMVDTLRAGRCSGRAKELEYFGLIARENERLTRLIDNFLTFSRMERNKQAFESDELAVEEIIAEAVDSVAEIFDRPGCRLETDIAAGLPHVIGDRDALITVVLNLLANAHKYSGDEKYVVVRAFATDSEVCLAVSDNGIGLTRHAARRVFEKFYQVDQRISRTVGGCGLGLSIVKFVVDAHGGSVSVESAPNKGSTFTVRLPALDEALNGSGEAGGRAHG